MLHGKNNFNSEILVRMSYNVRLVLNRSELRPISLYWILYKPPKPDFVKMIAAVWKTNVHI
jgi:hypothetical protein